MYRGRRGNPFSCFCNGLPRTYGARNDMVLYGRFFAGIKNFLKIRMIPIDKYSMLCYTQLVNKNHS